MPGSTTFSQGLTASLLAVSQSGSDVGHPSDNGGVSLTAGQQAQAPGDTDGGPASVRRLSVEPRHVADGTARASARLACGGAVARKSAGSPLVTLKGGMPRPPGAAMAHIQVADANTAHAPMVDDPTTMSLAQEAGIKKKMTVKIYWRPRGQSEARRTGRQDTTGGALGTLPAAPNAPRPPALPALTEKLAAEVAAHMQGRAGTGAQAYLAALAAQQRHRGDSALSALVGMLASDAQPAYNRDAPAERGIARQAAEAWLLADFLQNEGGANTGQTLFIARLNAHIDNVLDTLAPDALWALCRRLNVDSALTLPQDSSTLSGRTGILFNAVGMSAARAAWAASSVCERVGKPLSTQELGVVLRDAVLTYKPGAAHDETALMGVAEDIARLTMERGQYLLMLQLRVRAGKMLRDKGIPVNELTGIAATVLPEAHYARTVASTLRRTLASASFPADGRTARYPADEEIRQRLATALDQFSDIELRAAADNLLSAHTAHMKRRVQAQGVQPAERAALGRQFTMLCEVLAQKLAQRLGDESGVPAWQSLRGWDWDNRFSRDTRALRPGGLARLGHAAYRGVQRLFASVFSSEQTDQQRIRHAYEQVVQAASGFADAVDRNRMRDTKAALDAARRDLASARLAKEASGLQGWTPDALRRFNESGARLMRAAHQYEALCNSPAGRMARAELQLPGNLVQLFETAFVDAIGKTSGASVNVLGRTVFDPGWLEALRGLHEIKHQAYQAGPRPAQSTLGRWFNRVHAPWQPPLGMADAQTLLFGLQNALGKEAGARASTEILRELARVRAGTAAGGAIAMPADDMPDEDDLRLLDDIRTLEQRFRPLDREFLATPARHGVDDALDRFIGMGMKRLSPGERARIEASVFNLDHRPPAWLEQEEMWQSVARCCQKAQARRPGAGAAAARRDSVQA